MNLSPMTLEYGERFGKLTVIRRVKSHSGWQYRCGCECGNSKTIVTARRLMKGLVKACLKCRSIPSANSDERNSS